MKTALLGLTAYADPYSTLHLGRFDTQDGSPAAYRVSHMVRPHPHSPLLERVLGSGRSSGLGIEDGVVNRQCGF